MTSNKAAPRRLSGLPKTPEDAAPQLTRRVIAQCEARRSELGLSCAELARRMGVTRAYVAKLLGGTQNSTVSSLVKLARALGCSLSINLVCGEIHRTAMPIPSRAISRHLLVTASRPGRLQRR